MFADILNDCVMCVELLAPGLPRPLVMPTLCVAGLGRSLVGVAGGATKAAVAQVITSSDWLTLTILTSDWSTAPGKEEQHGGPRGQGWQPGDAGQPGGAVRQPCPAPFGQVRTASDWLTQLILISDWLTVARPASPSSCSSSSLLCTSTATTEQSLASCSLLSAPPGCTCCWTDTERLGS